MQFKHLSSTTGELPKPDLGRQVAALIADLDGDGVNDYVIASYEKMAWFQHTPNGWTPHLIEGGDPSVRMEAGGDTLDISGDGRPDIVMGAQSERGEIWWWENPGPGHPPDQPWQRHLALAVGGTHHDQIVGDFDGDGKPELAFWYNAGKQLYLARIPADPTGPWPHKLIAQLDPNGANPEGLAKIDLDGDGRLEIVGAGHWFKHLEGDRFEDHVIDPDYRFSRSAAGDLIRGGWAEVVINSGDGVGPLNLYQWDGAAWRKQTLIDRVDHGHTLQVADLDGEGNLDIYAAEMHTPGPGAACRQWILWGDGQGGFCTELLSTGIGSHESKVGDLNGDGRLDILQKDFQQDRRVDIWLNQGRP
ncbi:MAG: VCBS repeat-containing protein [Armatimonadetes bacterium]|nr:VCBS repeat-containing protein [Armatimonadota bacterium]